MERKRNHRYKKNYRKKTDENHDRKAQEDSDEEEHSLSSDTFKKLKGPSVTLSSYFSRGNRGTLNNNPRFVYIERASVRAKDTKAGLLEFSRRLSNHAHNSKLIVFDNTVHSLGYAENVVPLNWEMVRAGLVVFKFNANNQDKEMEFKNEFTILEQELGKIVHESMLFFQGFSNSDVGFKALYPKYNEWMSEFKGEDDRKGYTPDVLLRRMKTGEIYWVDSRNITDRRKDKEEDIESELWFEFATIKTGNRFERSETRKDRYIPILAAFRSKRKVKMGLVRLILSATHFSSPFDYNEDYKDYLKLCMTTAQAIELDLVTKSIIPGKTDEQGAILLESFLEDAKTYSEMKTGMKDEIKIENDSVCVKSEKDCLITEEYVKKILSYKNDDGKIRECRKFAKQMRQTMENKANSKMKQEMLKTNEQVLEEERERLKAFETENEKMNTRRDPKKIQKIMLVPKKNFLKGEKSRQQTKDSIKLLLKGRVETESEEGRMMKRVWEKVCEGKFKKSDEEISNAELIKKRQKEISEIMEQLLGTEDELEFEEKEEEKEKKEIADLIKQLNELLEQKDFSNEDRSKDEINSYKFKKTNKKQEQIRDRVRKMDTRVDLSSREKRELAKKGVNGKKESDKTTAESLRVDNSRHFHHDTDVKDLDEFVDNGHDGMLEEIKCNGWDNMERECGKLRSLANSFFGKIPLKRSEVYGDRLLKTKLGMSLMVLDMITQELVVTFNQLTTDGVFVLKEVCEGLYMLAKSAGPNRSVYYSIICDKSCFEKLSEVFKMPCYEDDSCMIFPFMSLNRQEFAHVVGSYSFMVMLPMWKNVFQKSCDVDSTMSLEEEYSGTREYTHFKFSLLVFLSSSANLSNDLMMVRYMYMLCATGSMLKSYPFKVLSKMHIQMRSRVHVMFYQRLKKAFENMILRPVKLAVAHKERKEEEIMNDDLDKEVDEVESRDKFDNLLSYVDGLPVESFGTVLNISYLGVLFNKEKGEELPGFLKIYTKIMEGEYLLEKTRVSFLGHEDNYILDDYREHEFSFQWMVAIADKLRSYIKAKKGISSNEVFESWQLTEMAHYLREENASKLGTLKASARFDWMFDEEESKVKLKAEDVTIDMDKKVTYGNGKMINNRSKVVESVGMYMKKKIIGIFPLCSMTKINNFIKDHLGGILVNLFKKLQLNGVREIFVLELCSRISILLLESWSKVLCKEIEMEMLTKGEDKYDVTKNFYRQVYRKQTFLNKAYKNKLLRARNLDSCDASGWAQSFMMRVFSVVVTFLAPEMMSPMMNDVLNNITSKKLELATKMLHLFRKYAEDVTKESKTDKFINMLKKEFTKETTEYRHFLKATGCVFLKNWSNMMQGQTHYLSSLIHIGHILLMEELNLDRFSEYILKEVIPKMEREKMFKTVEEKDLYVAEFLKSGTFMQCGRASSDDSAHMRYIALPPTNDNDTDVFLTKVLYAFLTNCSLVMTYSYPMFGAKSSAVKSSIDNRLGIIEFNSVWEVQNNTLSILIKFLEASRKLKPTAVLIARLESYANLLKQCIENGVNFFLASIMSDMQERMHYDTLGAFLNMKGFKHYSWLLEICSHPSLGFFVKQPELCNGLLGFDIAYYNCIKKSKNAKLLENLLLSQEDLEFSETGRPTINLFVAMGELTKYKKFLERMKNYGFADKNWREYGNKNLETLFEKPWDENDMIFNINKLILTPSVADSMSYVNSANLYRLAAYITSFQSVTVRFSRRGKDVVNQTYSLVELLLQLCKDVILNKHEKLEKERIFTRLAEISGEGRVFDTGKENTPVKDEDEKKVAKIREIKEDEKSDTSEEMVDFSGEDNMSIWFPAKDFYNAVLKSNKELSKRIFYKTDKVIASRQIKFSVPLNLNKSSVTLKDCVRYMWTKKFEGSETAHRICWNAYKGIYKSWLCDTLEETLIKSKHKDAVALVAFISRISTRRKQVMGLAPVSDVRSPLIVVQRMMESFYQVKMKIGTKKVFIKTEVTDKYLELSKRLFNCISLKHMDRSYTDCKIKKIIDEFDDPLSKMELIEKQSTLSQMNVNLAEMGAMISALKEATRKDVEKKDRRDFSDLIVTLMGGSNKFTYGFFKVRQKATWNEEKERYTYSGAGVLEIFTKGSRLMVNVEDDMVVEIIDDHESKWSENIVVDSLVKHLKQIGFRGMTREEFRERRREGMRTVLHWENSLLRESGLSGQMTPIYKGKLDFKIPVVRDLKLRVDHRAMRASIEVVDMIGEIVMLKHSLDSAMISKYGLKEEREEDKKGVQVRIDILSEKEILNKEPSLEEWEHITGSMTNVKDELTVLNKYIMIEHKEAMKNDEYKILHEKKKIQLLKELKDDQIYLLDKDHWSDTKINWRDKKNEGLKMYKFTSEADTSGKHQYVPLKTAYRDVANYLSVVEYKTLKGISSRNVAKEIMRENQKMVEDSEEETKADSGESTEEDLSGKDMNDLIAEAAKRMIMETSNDEYEEMDYDDQMVDEDEEGDEDKGDIRDEIEMEDKTISLSVGVTDLLSSIDTAKMIRENDLADKTMKESMKLAQTTLKFVWMQRNTYDLLNSMFNRYFSIDKRKRLFSFNDVSRRKSGDSVYEGVMIKLLALWGYAEISIPKTTPKVVYLD